MSNEITFDFAKEAENMQKKKDEPKKTVKKQPKKEKKTIKSSPRKSKFDPSIRPSENSLSYKELYERETQLNKQKREALEEFTQIQKQKDKEIQILKEKLAHNTSSENTQTIEKEKEILISKASLAKLEGTNAFTVYKIIKQFNGLTNQEIAVKLLEIDENSTYYTARNATQLLNKKHLIKQNGRRNNGKIWIHCDSQ